MIKVEQNATLARDPSTKAIVAVERSALEQNRKMRETMRSFQTSFQKNSELEDKVSKLSTEISELKELLMCIINKDK